MRRKKNSLGYEFKNIQHNNNNNGGIHIEICKYCHECGSQKVRKRGIGEEIEKLYVYILILLLFGIENRK